MCVGCPGLMRPLFRKSVIRITLIEAYIVRCVQIWGGTTAIVRPQVYDDLGTVFYFIFFRKGERVMKKKFVFILFGMLLCIGLTACGNNTAGTSDNDHVSLDFYKQRGYLTLGFDQEFEPMGFVDGKSGEYIGFDINMATEVMKRMGIELRLQPISWDIKESELNRGKIDFIWNGYSITEERKEKVDFSNPYLNNTQAIVVLADSDIQSKADLAGKEVGTQGGSSTIEAVEAEPEVLASFKNSSLVLMPTFPDILRDLENNRIDAVVGDIVLLRYYIDKMGAEKFRILEDNFGSEEYGVGMRKTDSELIAEVNRIMEEMKADGTATQISEKWFGENIVK